ncbi:MAG: alpha/beta hydrolase [Cyclobacteriaceae bacterium]
MKKTASSILLLFALISQAQEINNFNHPEGYTPGKWGELGEIKEFGSGEKSMILLPGWGFDWTIFQDFIDKYRDEYKLYAVTMPGFGNTPAPPMPADPTNFQDLNWTNGVINGISQLMEERNISNPILVSYFTYSNVIALRMAIDNPDDFSQVIILSGMAKFTSNFPAHEPRNLAQRITYVEKFLAPQWFKTVNKNTWDSGNFHPKSFTKDSVKSKKHWDMMSAVAIPTMVRYLCEYYCTDLSIEYSKLKVPTLVVIPSFTDDLLYKKETSYLAPFFHNSWLGARPAGESISIIALTDTNAFMIEDQPGKLFTVINEFLADKLNLYQVIR